VRFDFEISGSGGFTKWDYSIQISAERRLEKALEDIYESKYRIIVTNLKGSSENSRHVNDKYKRSIRYRNEHGEITYRETPELSSNGIFVFLERNDLPVHLPDVPKKGQMEVTIKPDMEEGNSMKNFKYLPLEKTVPASELTTGDTIRLNLKKNPQYEEDE